VLGITLGRHAWSYQAYINVLNQYTGIGTCPDPVEGPISTPQEFYRPTALNTGLTDIRIPVGTGSLVGSYANGNDKYNWTFSGTPRHRRRHHHHH
jgi:hypothetical protein